MSKSNVKILTFEHEIAPVRDIIAAQTEGFVKIEQMQALKNEITELINEKESMVRADMQAIEKNIQTIAKIINQMFGVELCSFKTSGPEGNAFTN